MRFPGFPQVPVMLQRPHGVRMAQELSPAEDASQLLTGVRLIAAPRKEKEQDTDIHMHVNAYIHTHIHIYIYAHIYVYMCM